VKPNINSVEVHPRLSNNGHLVDGALVDAGSLWPASARFMACLQLVVRGKVCTVVEFATCLFRYFKLLTYIFYDVECKFIKLSYVNYGIINRI
jgi:hypothetical protein